MSWQENYGGSIVKPRVVLVTNKVFCANVAAGGTIIEVSPEDRAAWANAMPTIAQEWVMTLNGAGEDGTEMPDAHLSKLEAGGPVSGRQDSGDSGQRGGYIMCPRVGRDPECRCCGAGGFNAPIPCRYDIV